MAEYSTVLYSTDLSEYLMSTTLSSILSSLPSSLFSLFSCFQVCFHASRMNIEASTHCLHRQLKNSEGGLKFQKGPLCPGGLNIPMYSFKRGFRP
jgi:hypothetical protein